MVPRTNCILFRERSIQLTRAEFPTTRFTFKFRGRHLPRYMPTQRHRSRPRRSPRALRRRRPAARTTSSPPRRKLTLAEAGKQRLSTRERPVVFLQKMKRYCRQMMCNLESSLSIGNKRCVAFGLPFCSMPLFWRSHRGPGRSRRESSGQRFAGRSEVPDG